MDKDQYVANILFNEAIIEEKTWRIDKKNNHDVILIDKMIDEINNNGYGFIYIADLTHREIYDINVLRIIQRYINTFSDEVISVELIGVIGQKKNYEATETIIGHYENSSQEHKWKQAAYYDNALYNIKDKRFINKYMSFLENEDDVIRLPLTMTMLAKWNINGVKEYFINYLCTQKRDLKFVAIECLSYYKKDDSVVEALNKCYDPKDKDVNNAIKRAIKKITK